MKQLSQENVDILSYQQAMGGSVMTHLITVLKKLMSSWSLMNNPLKISSKTKEDEWTEWIGCPHTSQRSQTLSQWTCWPVTVWLLLIVWRIRSLNVLGIFVLNIEVKKRLLLGISRASWSISFVVSLTCWCSRDFECKDNEFLYWLMIIILIF